MYMDKGLEFADATALDTSGTGTKNVGNLTNLVKARDIGVGQKLYLVLQVVTAPTSGGSATLQFQLVSDGVTTPATSGAQTIHLKTDDYAVADLTQGWQRSYALPEGDGDAANTTGYEQYLGIQQVVGTAALTGGSINAFLTHEPPTLRTYDDANN